MPYKFNIFTGTFDKVLSAVAGADEKVGIDSDATAGYIGAASNDGVLRAGSNLSYVDGGNFVTLNIADSPTVSGDNFSNVNITDQSVDELSDVDTTTAVPTANDVLMWDGNNFVPVPEGTTFEFSINTYTDNEATPQLIGAGTWESTGNITFDMTYNNGPPTAGKIILTSDGGVTWASDLTLTSPFLTDDSAENTAYPNNKDKYVRFTLDVDKSAENDTSAVTVYFRNYIRWGVSTKSSGFNEADIEGLSSSAISNDQTRSMSINAGASQYLVFAFPASYTGIPYGSDYEDDSTTGFKFNSIACAFTQDTTTLSITNSAGYTENYEVYASTVANLGNHTLVTTTSASQIDPLYYGITEKTDTFTEADIEGLATNEITNDNTQIWDAVTTGVNEYMLFAFPKRLGTVTFWVGGFEGGFESPETVSVTNSNGWSEDYYVWRSENSNLGETIVETR